ncbi:segregation/condensation protein A [candidate division KSB1 bacterium]|nr:segregation/condensation protein A [candidate division KSB1 bacterium]
MAVYRVQLENFDGPLDLLLFLIKKNEVDLFDIPIAEITRQYLEYLDILKLLDLESASDFILMAATLIRIKAKMLLPKSPVEEDEEEEEDPREELVRRLLEYQRFKEVAMQMSDLADDRAQLYTRQYRNGDYDDLETEFDPTDGAIAQYTLFELIAAFKSILSRAPKVTEHMVEQIPVSTEQQMDYLLEKIDKQNGQVLFYQAIEALQNRISMIVTFLALLELIRRRVVAITQSSTFGEIWIKRNE